MKLIVAGSRSIPTSIDIVEEAMSKTGIDKGKIDKLITGMASRGPDMGGYQWGVLNLGSERVIEAYADWDQFGKSAGFIRNISMATQYGATDLLAILDTSVDSKGTRHMIETAKKNGLNVMVYEINGAERFPRKATDKEADLVDSKPKGL